ncbi:MAG TPA: adenine deaminase C-terminal domain-containing protein [Spirochaetia bacterium]|nr:adenine deaminase C-terminal domain-containing protein [Spirochaetia bacterium]
MPKWPGSTSWRPAWVCPRGGDPFMALSSLALPVIPLLKLTDLGLVDVEPNCLVDLAGSGSA